MIMIMMPGVEFFRHQTAGESCGLRAAWLVEHPARPGFFVFCLQRNWILLPHDIELGFFGIGFLGGRVDGL